MSNENRLQSQRSDGRGQIAEVKTETALAPFFAKNHFHCKDVNLCNPTSDL